VRVVSLRAALTTRIAAASSNAPRRTQVAAPLTVSLSSPLPMNSADPTARTTT
jgi:hypothetical protein